MSIVDKLTPPPPPVEMGAGMAAPEAPTPKEALTAEEASLLDRAKTFIATAMKRHGISPSPNDSHWIGAEIADFVLAEAARVEAAVEEAVKPKGKK